MIISGGVNVYPQEAENVLIGHPAVDDVAVFGIPHAGARRGGQGGRAAARRPDRRTAELEAELIAYCHERLAKYKCPRSIDFADELPRHPTGKLYKRLLRDRYAGRADGGLNSPPICARSGGASTRCARRTRGRAVVPAAAAAILGDAVGQRVPAGAGRGILPRRLRDEPRTGLGGARARARRWPARGLEDIRALVCTHMHADHAGLAATLIERTGCELLRGLGPHTVDDLLRDPGDRALGAARDRPARGRPGGRGRPLGRRAPRRRRPSQPGARAPPARAGDVLHGWLVRAQPGHSPTQIALVDEQRRGRSPPTWPTTSPSRSWSGAGRSTPTASISPRSTASPSSPRGCCCPATGGRSRTAPQRLAAARAAAEALASNALAALADGPRSAYELAVAAVADPEENNRRQSMLSISLCVLEHLERRGAVTSALGADGVRRSAA